MRPPGLLTLLSGTLLLVGGARAARAQLPGDVVTAPVGPGDRPLSWLHHTRWLLGRDLPIGGVRSLVRTPDGYLWAGSSDGLIRYDGVRFDVLTGETTPELESGVPGTTLPLLLDRAGTLWVGRADGALVRYVNGAFEEALPPSTGRAAVEAAVQDGTGRIWLRSGPQLFAVEDGKWIDRPLPEALADVRVGNVAADTADGVWIGTVSQGLWHVRAGIARRVPYPVGDDQGQVTPVLQTREGKLWVVGNGMMVGDEHGWTRVTDEGRDLVARSAVQAVDGSVWLATRSGLVRERAGRLERLGGLTSDLTGKVLLDGEGSVWVATEGGLDRLRTSAFVTIGPDSGLPVETPLHIHPDAGGGVWVLDYATRRSYLLDDGPVRRRGGSVTTTAVPGDAIPITESTGGGLWFQTLHSDRVHLVKEGRVTDVRRTPALSWTSARAGVEGADGVLWLTARAGGLGTVRDFTYTPLELPDVDGTPRVASLGLDGSAHAWVSLTDRPLLFEVTPTGVVARFDESSGVVAGLDALTLEGGDTLWAVTPAMELARSIGGRVTRLSVPGLAPALAAGSVVLLVGGEHLWIGSSGGIGRLPLGSLHAAADGSATAPAPRWFGEADGLTMGRTTLDNRQAGFVARDGRLWFATPAGVTVVDPTAIPSNSVPPPVVIEDLRVAGRFGSVADGGSIAPHPERVEVRFAATSLRTPERVRVEYRMEGADADWVPADATRSATYTQLRPGRYVFHVRAWNEDGVPATSEARHSFRVLPLWYETRGFLVGLALASLGLCTAAVYVVQRARAHAAAELLRAEFDAALGERTRLARELHDTLLQGFTGVVLQLQALKGVITRSSPEAAGELEGVLRVADGTLREARQMVSHMRSPSLAERGLCETLRSAAHEAVAGTGIELSFSTHGAMRKLPDELEMVLLRVGREAVVNAVRHGDPDRILVGVDFAPDSVRVHVTDDGLGADPSEVERASAGGHWGIEGMRERARHAGGRLDIDSAPGAGMRVTITLPTDPS